MEYRRKSIRLRNYDYFKEGWYFVTICSRNREEMFGKIVGARRDAPQMKLNNNGKIIKKIWLSLPNYHSVILDEFCIMPNHIHLILIIKNNLNYQGASRRAPTLGWIIGMFKTECSKLINRLNETPGLKIFQRNYFERIIRNQKELEKIREYIRLNLPAGRRAR